VGVDVSHQDLGLIQDDTALGVGERPLRNMTAELRHGADGAQVVVRGQDESVGVGHGGLLGE
jgi:hypothetical protein